MPFPLDDCRTRGHLLALRQTEPRFHPGDVEREHPRGCDVLSPALLQDGVPQRLGPFALAPDLVSEIAGVSGPGDVARNPLELRPYESKVLQFLHRAIRSFEQDRPRRRALEG